MFYISKNPKWPFFLFIAASLASLILLPIFYVFFKTLLISNTAAPALKENNLLKNTGLHDPLITKAPNLKDAISRPLINNNDPSLGPENAPLTIVEFSDFTCSFCQLEEKKLKQIIDLYKNKIRLIWKDYPEDNPASISWQAAKAARCAYKQNKFWPYHDLLFKNKNFNQERFIELSQQINLDKEKFKECLVSKEMNNYLKQNINEANALGITGVPFTYINDQEIMGEVSLEELKRIVENEL